MSLTPGLPSYKETSKALQQTPANYNAAQVHGLMCGLICAGKIDSYWEKIIFGKEKKPQALTVLQQLYETSYQQMSEFSFEFNLLLPEDKIDINQRAEALGLWCQGFLTGLEQGKIAITNREPDEISEAIDDMIEISEVNYGDIGNNEEDETAYFELVEYVRLAVLMIFHELRSDTHPDTSENKDNFLH